MASKRKAAGRGRKGVSLDALQEQEDSLVASLFGGVVGSSAGKVKDSRTGAGRSAGRDGAQDGHEDEQADDDDEQGEPYTGLEHVDDEQLFSIDGGASASASDDDEVDEDDAELSEIDYEAESDMSGIEEDGAADEAEAVRPPSTYLPTPDKVTKPASKRRRTAAAWSDPDDAQLIVALAGAGARAADGSFVGTKRLRKLRQHPDETEVNGLEYEARLRKVFEQLHPRPAWASRARKADSIDYDAPSAARASSDTFLLSELLSQDTGLVARATNSRSRGRLMPDQLDMERLRNANEAQGRDDDAVIESLGFHPTSNADILMCATRNRKVRLFQIDGKANPLLHTIHLPDLTLETALFHPRGTTAFFAGSRPFFYTHDFITGTTTRSLPWRGSVEGGFDSAEAERDLSKARFAPLGASAGDLLAVGGRRGAVHLLDWGQAASSSSSSAAAAGSNGRGSLVGSIRMNAPLAGMAWDPSPSASGRRLVTLSKEGRAHVWDVRNLRCEAVRVDLGLYAPNGLEVSPTAILPPEKGQGGGGGASHAWVVGSENGIVSVYDDAFSAVAADAHDASSTTTASAPASSSQSWTHQETISARKTVENLTTSITTMRFNSDGQMCAVASRNKKDALRMMHSSTLRIFPNWPTAATPLGHVTAVDFSRSGGYAVVGNSKGRVLLYEVKHYTS